MALKHGAARGPYKQWPIEYRAWRSMRNRCLNPRHRSYDRYGARGIKICPRWNDYATFLRDMGPAPSGDHTIGRQDADKNYCPCNCSWETRGEQNRSLPQNQKGYQRRPKLDDTVPF